MCLSTFCCRYCRARRWKTKGDEHAGSFWREVKERLAEISQRGCVANPTASLRVCVKHAGRLAAKLFRPAIPLSRCSICFYLKRSGLRALGWCGGPTSERGGGLAKRRIPAICGRLANGRGQTDDAAWCFGVVREQYKMGIERRLEWLRG